MAPYALVFLGITIYYLNNYKGYNIGIRGLPWLNAPLFFVIAGVIAFVIKMELKRRAKARAERHARGEL